MKYSFRIPVLAKVMLYFLICEFMVFVSQFITGFFAFRGPVATNSLLCILLLFVTRSVLRFEGLVWSDAGLQMNSRSYRQLFAGMLTGVLMLFAVALIIRQFAGFEWKLNPGFLWWQLPSILLVVFCSAFAQELAFRGYPFLLMYSKWGEWPAQLVTAMIFGCMHFHEGMNMQAMLLAMLTTGAGSFLFGMATIRTGNIWLATGIHYGWNLLQYLLPRSLEENGKGIWLVNGKTNAQPGILIYIVPYLFVVALVYLMTRGGSKRKDPVR